MPNKPDPNTVATSFTLPRPLLDKVEELAAMRMTNKSNVIRDALMNHLTPEQRAWVEKEIAESFKKKGGNK